MGRQKIFHITKRRCFSTWTHPYSWKSEVTPNDARLLLWSVGWVVLLLPHPESTVPRPPLPAAFHRCPDTVRHSTGPHEPVRKEWLAGRARAGVYHLHRPGSAGIPLLRRTQGGQAVPGTGTDRPDLPNAINRTIRSICADYNKEEESKAKEENRDPVFLPKFSCHILRHTFCTRFCENETNLKVIQEIMGHADISTTMDVYAEATQEKKKESMTSLQSALLVR